MGICQSSAQKPVETALCCLNPFAIEKRFITCECTVVEEEVRLTQDEITALAVQALLTENALAETHRIVAEIRAENAQLAAEAQAESERLTAEAQAEQERLNAEAKAKQDRKDMDDAWWTWAINARYC